MKPALPNWDDLPLSRQIAQMLVVRASGFLFDHQIRYPAWEPPAATLHRWVADLGVGGVILLGGSAAEVAMKSHQLQEWAAVPLLIAADIEEGVGQRFAGASWFPPPMALGAIALHDRAKAMQYAEAMGSVTAQEAIAIGLNWVLAPVVDVNNNPANPVINVRAFGDTPDRVSDLATAFIRGAQRHAVLTCAKHFPGHGDTATDSHLDLPLMSHSRQRLLEVEWPPFQAAIAAGVEAVMSAHLLIPSLDSQYPATLSERILTGELRQAMGFDGLIVTDALVMGAIANRYGVNEAPVMAVEAGADVLMMPLDPEGAIQALVEAVESGRISVDRIHASLERIWRAKHHVCTPAVIGDTTHAWEAIAPTQPVDRIHQLATDPAIATIHDILADSMQVYLPPDSRLHNPRWCTTPLRNLIVVDEALGHECLGYHTPAIAHPKARGYTLQCLDRHTPAIACSPESEAWQPTLLQVFIRGNPFRGSADLTHIATEWFQHLVHSDQLQALVVYGSPYVVQQFLPHLPPDVPFIFSYGQMPQAQAIALNRLLPL